MLIKRLQVGVLATNCYVLGCEETREAAVIDPGGDGEKFCKKLPLLASAQVYYQHPWTW